MPLTIKWKNILATDSSLSKHNVLAENSHHICAQHLSVNPHLILARTALSGVPVEIKASDLT